MASGVPCTLCGGSLTPDRRARKASFQRPAMTCAHCDAVCLRPNCGSCARVLRVKRGL